MKKQYITLYESKYYHKMSKLSKKDEKDTFEKNFDAANLIHLAAQRCVLDHGKNSVMFDKTSAETVFIHRVLSQFPKSVDIIEKVYEESKKINKGGFERAIEDRVANTRFVVENVLETEFIY